MNYYNEIDLGARRWLRELIKDGLIPDGFIDNRPIQEIESDELTRAGFIQCHFFAGIGGWPYALRLAGIPDNKPLWSGSCPCQPFSDSGDKMGFADPRHLFPTWRRLIARGNPPIVFGEQVASKLGREWLARVRLEMATLGYATRAADLCSAGVAAPNLRQRLFWMADADREHGDGTGFDSGHDCGKFQSTEAVCAIGADPLADAGSLRRLKRAEQHGKAKQDSANRDPQGRHTDGCGELRRMGNTGRGRDELLGQRGDARSAPCETRGEERQQRSGDAIGDAGARSGSGRLGDTDDEGREGRRLQPGDDARQRTPWSTGLVGIRCTDGKTRRIKPEIFPLAARLPGDLALIRGAGNAINPWIAKAFIESAIPESCHT